MWYHAAPHVFKHLTLGTRIIALMSRKEQPFAYLDTHAGIGLYDLQGDQASRTGEYLEGIARLWDQPDLPALTADYMKVLHDMNPDGQLLLRGSPGSAWRCDAAAGSGDAQREAPGSGASCSNRMAGDRRVKVHLGEGCMCRVRCCRCKRSSSSMKVPALCRVAERGDRPDAQTLAAIWYPVKDQRMLRRFYQDLAGSGAPKLLRVELRCIRLIDRNTAPGWRLRNRRGWKRNCVSCCRGCPRSLGRLRVGGRWIG